MYKKGNGQYYKINVENGNTVRLFFENRFSITDGHPSMIDEEKFISDTYPNRNRMQKLLRFNLKKKEVEILLNMHNSLKFSGICRCDLHPRFDIKNETVYFDSVHTGERSLNFIKL